MHEVYCDFLRSALTEVNPFMPTAQFSQWLEERRRAHAFLIERIPFRKLEGWGFEPSTGNLTHASGRFFRIEGIWVETNYGGKPQWSQPIINQPEIGLLGILTKKVDGDLLPNAG
jgi:oxidase EvaA